MTQALFFDSGEGASDRARADLEGAGVSVLPINYMLQGLDIDSVLGSDVIVVHIANPEAERCPAAELLRRVCVAGAKSRVLAVSGETELPYRFLCMGLDDGQYVSDRAEPGTISRAALRIADRRRPQTPPESIEGLILHEDAALFAFNGKPIRFSPDQYAILELLFRNFGQSVEISALERAMYGEDGEARSRNNLSVKINYIRSRLKEAGCKAITIRGVWSGHYTLARA